MTEEIRTLCDIGDDAIPFAVVEICEFLGPDGERRWCLRCAGDVPLSSSLGLLRMAEHQLLAESADWPLP